MSVRFFSISRLLLIALCLMMLLLLAGCGGDDAEEVNPIEEDAVVEEIDYGEALSTTSSVVLQAAYTICQEEGHQAGLFFNGQTIVSELFCVFDSGARCPAEAYLLGTCTEDLANEALELLTALQALEEAEEDVTVVDGEGEDRFCETDTQPVCGIDGKTYTNRCLAEQAAMLVDYEGACTVIDTEQKLEDAEAVEVRVTEERTTFTRDTNPPPSASRSTFRSTRSSNTGPLVSEEDLVEPVWRGNVMSLGGLRMEQCYLSRRTYYYVDTQIDVLYDSDGEVVCYPEADINGNCPDDFILNDRARTCLAF